MSTFQFNLIIFLLSCRCHSSAGVEQTDVYLPHEGERAEILYTVRDVSDVEQGQGGFVRSIKGTQCKG